MLKLKEKKERALGIKLFLKGERCGGPKCAMVRRPYPPGMHGKKRRKTLSEYGRQLLEKQRLKAAYGLKEAQLIKITEKIFSKTENIGERMIAALESQLNNVVFRLGFAPSRMVAGQIVSHGHILLNGKKINSSSCLVRVGDVVSIKPSSKNLLIFKELPNTIKKHEPPLWLEIDKEKLEGKIKSLPQTTELPFDVNLVIDYYSK